MVHRWNRPGKGSWKSLKSLLSQTVATLLMLLTASALLMCDLTSVAHTVLLIGLLPVVCWLFASRVGSARVCCCWRSIGHSLMYELDAFWPKSLIQRQNRVIVRFNSNWFGDTFWKPVTGWKLVYRLTDFLFYKPIMNIIICFVSYDINKVYTKWRSKGPLHTLNQMVNQMVNHLLSCWRVAGNPNPRLKVT